MRERSEGRVRGRSRVPAERGPDSGLDLGSRPAGEADASLPEPPGTPCFTFSTCLWVVCASVCPMVRCFNYFVKEPTFAEGGSAFTRAHRTRTCFRFLPSLSSLPSHVCVPGTSEALES